MMLDAEAMHTLSHWESPRSIPKAKISPSGCAGTVGAAPTTADRPPPVVVSQRACARATMPVEPRFMSLRQVSAARSRAFRGPSRPRSSPNAAITPSRLW